MKNRFETFTVLIASINRSIYRIKTEEMAEFNLKSSHVSCLYYLYKEKALTSKELCVLCGEDKSNISRALKYLEENGYIAYEPSEKKRYNRLLELSSKGLDTGKKIAEKIDNILESASIGLSEEDRLTMYRGLSLISNNLNNVCDENN